MQFYEVERRLKEEMEKKGERRSCFSSLFFSSFFLFSFALSFLCIIFKVRKTEEDIRDRK